VDSNRQDFVVGLVLVAAIAVVVGALIATSGWGERRYNLYMNVPTAEGLSTDSRVLVKGLEVGRVTRIVPRADPRTRDISFVARLSVAERFKDGSTLRLPLGTSAELAQASQISANLVVRLILPDSTHHGTGLLAAGDTIQAHLKGTTFEQLAQVASHLSDEMVAILHESHQTLLRVQTTLAQAQQTLRDLTPEVRGAVGSLAATMGRVDSITGRIAQTGLADSVSSALTSSNQLLHRLDSLVSEAHAVTQQNRADLRETVVNLAEVSRQLNHFVDQLSRRPYRLLTGVKPLPPDTTKSVTAKGTGDSLPPPRRP
jgi:ABC-type transporter Mla subunit MlaD